MNELVEIYGMMWYW